jgi:hypothetical protein
LKTHVADGDLQLMSILQPSELQRNVNDSLLNDELSNDKLSNAVA